MFYRFLRSSVRQGLMRCRMLASSEATAPVLTFLDSHIEVGHGWLEPLLYSIKENRRVRFALLVCDSPRL